MTPFDPCFLSLHLRGGQGITTGPGKDWRTQWGLDVTLLWTPGAHSTSRRYEGSPLGSQSVISPSPDAPCVSLAPATKDKSRTAGGSSLPPSGQLHSASPGVLEKWSQPCQRPPGLSLGIGCGFGTAQLWAPGKQTSGRPGVQGASCRPNRAMCVLFLRAPRNSWS